MGVYFRGRQFGGQGRHWPVHQDIAEVVQQFLSPVQGRGQSEKLGVFVDKVGVHRAVNEFLVVLYVKQEWYVSMQ